jgi:two-component system, CitB family, sensor kinase
MLVTLCEDAMVFARRDASVARQLLAWQILVVTVLVVGGIGLAISDARSNATAIARQRSLDLALSVADSPTVRSALLLKHPSGELQPFAEAVRRDTDTDFVVVMSPQGIRYTHPDPKNIGKRFIGNIAEAQKGRRLTETYTGTLGPSVRAVVPVFDDGRVVALVSVGITREKVDRDVISAIPRIVGAAAAVGLIGVVGAWLIHRRLRRQTHGLGEREITRMFEYYDAVLRAVREGLLLLDDGGRIVLFNDEATRLLGLDEHAVGSAFSDLGLAVDLDDVAESVQVVGDRTLIVNHAPARWEGRTVGSVVTFRDRTELQAVTAELDTVRGLAEALRAQNHETSNRLHTMVSLIEIGRPSDAVAFATSELDLAQALTDRMVSSIEEPVVAALLLGKSAQAAERGVRLSLSDTSHVSGTLLAPHETVTVLGNLLDNAIDAAQGSAGRSVSVELVSTDERLEARIEDSGPGIADGDAQAVFERGWTTKEHDGTGRGLGLALVEQVVRRHGGSLQLDQSELGGAMFTVSLSRQDPA